MTISSARERQRAKLTRPLPTAPTGSPLTTRMSGPHRRLHVRAISIECNAGHHGIFSFRYCVREKSNPIYGDHLEGLSTKILCYVRSPRCQKWWGKKKVLSKNWDEIFRLGRVLGPSRFLSDRSTRSTPPPPPLIESQSFSRLYLLTFSFVSVRRHRWQCLFSGWGVEGLMES